MCDVNYDWRMAGLHTDHLSLLQEAAPRVSGITNSLFLALIANLNTRLPVLPALIAMAEQVQDGDFGVLCRYNLVYLPITVVGDNGYLYKTKTISDLHDSIIPLRMSDLTVYGIRKALKPHDLCILFHCPCAVVMGNCRDVVTFYGSEDHRRMDFLRSGIDFVGSPVVQVSSLDDILVPTMGFHSNGAERRLIARIENLIGIVVTRSSDYSRINRELQDSVPKVDDVIYSDSRLLGVDPSILAAFAAIYDTSITSM